MTFMEYFDMANNYYITGAIVTFLILSGTYVFYRPKDNDFIPADIGMSCIILSLSAFWIIYTPIILGIFMVYVWIRLICWVAGK